jgi:uncharacterized protein
MAGAPDRGGGWVMFMRWAELAFLHWPVPVELLRPLVPAPLEIDTFDGEAWVGVVPFRMERTRARLAPRVPTASTFPEINVRTYVRGGGRSGVWFFSLDAASRLAVRGARATLNLPYHHAEMAMAHAPPATPLLTPSSDLPPEPEPAMNFGRSTFGPGGVRFVSRRTGRGAAAEFAGTYRATGDVYRAMPGSLDHWLTERYHLFGQRRGGAVYAMEVRHAPWPLQPGAAVVERNTMAAASGVELPETPPLVHVAGALDVHAWPPERIR